METEDDKYYELSETPIKDKSMLGPHGQELCNNVDVHWMIQTCDTDGIDNGNRKHVHVYVCV